MFHRQLMNEYNRSIFEYSEQVKNLVMNRIFANEYQEKPAEKKLQGSINDGATV